MIGIEYDARVNSETDELYDFLYQFNNAIIGYYAAVQCNPPDANDNWLYKCWAGLDGYHSSHTDHMRQLTKEYFELINEEV